MSSDMCLYNPTIKGCNCPSTHKKIKITKDSIQPGNPSEDHYFCSHDSNNKCGQEYSLDSCSCKNNQLYAHCICPPSAKKYFIPRGSISFGNPSYDLYTCCSPDEPNQMCDYIKDISNGKRLSAAQQLQGLAGVNRTKDIAMKNDKIPNIKDNKTNGIIATEVSPTVGVSSLTSKTEATVGAETAGDSGVEAPDGAGSGIKLPDSIDGLSSSVDDIIPDGLIPESELDKFKKSKEKKKSASSTKDTKNSSESESSKKSSINSTSSSEAFQILGMDWWIFLIIVIVILLILGGIYYFYKKRNTSYY